MSEVDSKDHNERSRSWLSSLVYGALLPSIVVAIGVVLVATVSLGYPGLLASLLASITVLIFFSVNLLVGRWANHLDPRLTLVVALLSYFLKLIVLGTFLLLVDRFTEPATIDRRTFAVASIVLTLAWLGGEIRAFLKIRYIYGDHVGRNNHGQL
ncbi:MAG: hypothetical protein ACKOFJ_02035 [Actinomycetota bacterium]